MTLDKTQHAFLFDLLSAPSPSGFESRAAARWRKEAISIGAEVDHDIAGNSWASNQGANGLHIVIEGHIDEIGFVITSIDADGFLWFAPIGGWDDQVVVGQRIIIAGRNGLVHGVIGKKAAHLLKPEDRKKVTTISDLWIDIGASDRASAQNMVEVGDPAVIDVTPLELPDDLLVSRSIDNRIGSFIALETLRSVMQAGTEHRVTALIASQEEITMAGAINAAHNLQPDVVIALDVTHATDYPGASAKSDNDIALGGGPVLTRGAAVNQKVFEALRVAGTSAEVETLVQAAGRSTGTDADGFRRSGIATAIGLVSIPNRYMHSPNEMISLRDVEGAVSLISTFVQNLETATDFRS